MNTVSDRPLLSKQSVDTQSRSSDVRLAMKRRLGGPTLAFHVLILSDCILTDLIAGGCKRSGWVEVQERGHAKEKTLLHFNLKKVSCSSRSN